MQGIVTRKGGARLRRRRLGWCNVPWPPLSAGRDIGQASGTTARPLPMDSGWKQATIAAAIAGGHCRHHRRGGGGLRLYGGLAGPLTGSAPDGSSPRSARRPGRSLGTGANHVKGICVSGMFEANGAGSALTTAPMFRQGSYPVVGRFSLGSADPAAFRRDVPGFAASASGSSRRMARNGGVPRSTRRSLRLRRLRRSLPCSRPPAARTRARWGRSWRRIRRSRHFGAWAGSAPWTGKLCRGAL